MKKKGIITIASIVLLLIGWQMIALWVNQPEWMPSLPRLITTLIELLTHSSFYLSVGFTLLRGLCGIFLSLVTATCLAVLFARFAWLHELFRPLLSLMRSVPVISFILLAVLFLHPESIPLLIGFLTMFPLLTENLTKGVRALRPELYIFSQQFRLGRRNKITQIIYPQLKPFLYSGLASAAGFGWRAIIMGEVLSQGSWGIGSEMKKAQTFIAVPELLAWTAVAILISYLTDKGIHALATQKIPITYASKNKEKMPPNGYLGLPIQLTDVSYRYGVSHFSYSFQAGKVYGLSAPSGTGKTTLINLINGTLIPTEGKIKINRRKGIASLFQEPVLLSHLTVEENIMLPLSRLFTREKAYSYIQSLIKEVEIEELTGRYPDELSYGQQQRVALIRALAYPSPFLFMDEPFKGLDSDLGKRIIECIKRRQATQKQTILFSSHQIEELMLLAEEVVYLKTPCHL